MSGYRYAYLHGFGSSPRSFKGLALQEIFDARGLPFERPDLNRPSFAALDHQAMLSALDALDAETARGAAGRPWRFIGSSLGGWLAARWAQLHPERVDALLLLCPGFHLETRWPDVIGAAQMARWEREGALPFADASGAMVGVHWGFIESARRQPGAPAVPCPTRIVHGVRDTVVPIASSRRYVAEHDRATLVEVDDDHSLAGSVERIVAELVAHFALDGASP